MVSAKDRLNAIADALETASKQVRLLAEEIEQRCIVEINTDDIAKAQQHFNRRVGVQAKSDNPQEFRR